MLSDKNLRRSRKIRQYSQWQYGVTRSVYLCANSAQFSVVGTEESRSEQKKGPSSFVNVVDERFMLFQLSLRQNMLVLFEDWLKYRETCGHLVLSSHCIELRMRLLILLYGCRELVLCALATIKDRQPRCLDAFASTGVGPYYSKLDLMNPGFVWQWCIYSLEYY